MQLNQSVVRGRPWLAAAMASIAAEGDEAPEETTADEGGDADGASDEAAPVDDGAADEGGDGAPADDATTGETDAPTEEPTAEALPPPPAEIHLPGEEAEAEAAPVDEATTDGEATDAPPAEEAPPVDGAPPDEAPADDATTNATDAPEESGVQGEAPATDEVTADQAASA